MKTELSGLAFARAIRRSALNGFVPATNAGLPNTWVFAEAAIHDTAHMVTLGASISRGAALGSDVHRILARLPRAKRNHNEVQTLAAEVVFFRSVGAFNRKGAEAEWINSALPQEITAAKVLRFADTVEARRHARLLARRLRYHCRRRRS